MEEEFYGAAHGLSLTVCRGMISLRGMGFENLRTGRSLGRTFINSSIVILHNRPLKQQDPLIEQSLLFWLLF